jgi:hypothetical protein
VALPAVSLGGAGHRHFLVRAATVLLCCVTDFPLGRYGNASEYSTHYRANFNIVAGNLHRTDLRTAAMATLSSDLLWEITRECARSHTYKEKEKGMSKLGIELD